MIYFFNNVLNAFDNCKWKLCSFIDTPIVYFLCKIKNISIGEKCHFYGMTIFKHGSRSIIHVGHNCTFRSKSTSNLIGINRPCIFSALVPNAKLKTGNNCGFSGTVIGCFSEITLGNNVRCGANTLITDSNWHLDDPRAGNPKPIFIADNVWLGVGVIVMKGVNIGENSVIGANSVVTKDIPANVVAAGNPCKVIKSIEQKHEN
jgi:acetyltransferase-like isoleucine patch superfamily enzyme